MSSSLIILLLFHSNHNNYIMQDQGIGVGHALLYEARGAPRGAQSHLSLSPPAEDGVGREQSMPEVLP